MGSYFKLTVPHNPVVISGYNFKTYARILDYRYINVDLYDLPQVFWENLNLDSYYVERVEESDGLNIFISVGDFISLYDFVIENPDLFDTDYVPIWDNSVMFYFIEELKKYIKAEIIGTNTDMEIST